MSVRNNTTMVVLLFAGLLAIQLFFILRTWDHTANNLELELESIVEDVYNGATNDSTFNSLLHKVVFDSNQNSIDQLNAHLSRYSVNEHFSVSDISFEIYSNKYSNRPTDFILNNVIHNERNFSSLKAHHLCLTCVLEDSYINRVSYLELGAMINNKKSLQLAELWLPIILSFLFLLLLSIFSIVVLRKWAIAQQLNLQKNGFINNLTHELKTPIFSIKLLSQLIIEKSKDPKLNEYGSRIKIEARHLEEQIHRILESTGLESGHLIRFTKIELSSFLINMCPSIQILCEHNGCEFEFQSTNSSDCYIHADEIHLKNVINALVDNAIKYGAEQPKVIIELVSQEGFYLINITDNGMGIPDSEKHNVLEKFFRLNMDDTNSVSGFGLGLFYASEATKQMKGSLDILNNNPQGTIISLHFKADVS